LTSRIDKLLYLFSRHFLFGWTLNRWLIVSLLVSPFICLLTFLNVSQWRWFLLAGLLLLAWGAIFTIWQIRKRGFLRFEPERLADEIPPDALAFPEKIPLRASGYFRVNNATRYFVEEEAHYQTFQTRERVVMVEISQTRYLLLSTSSEAEMGWWYTFFTPRVIKRIESGQIQFGGQIRPALRLTYLPEATETAETIYLSFEDAAHRARVLADLQADEVDGRGD